MRSATGRQTPDQNSVCLVALPVRGRFAQSRSTQYAELSRSTRFPSGVPNRRYIKGSSSLNPVADEHNTPACSSYLPRNTAMVLESVGAHAWIDPRAYGCTRLAKFCRSASPSPEADISIRVLAFTSSRFTKHLLFQGDAYAGEKARRGVPVATYNGNSYGEPNKYEASAPAITRGSDGVPFGLRLVRKLTMPEPRHRHWACMAVLSKSDCRWADTFDRHRDTPDQPILTRNRANN